MIIQVDQEGKSVIEQLCNLALMQGGMSNRVQINTIIDSIELLSKAKPEVKFPQKEK